MGAIILKYIVGPFIALIISRGILAALHELGYYPDLWVAGLIIGTPQAFQENITWVASAVVAAILTIAWNFFNVGKGIKSWGKRLQEKSGKFDVRIASQADDPFILLHEAALMAYEETRGTRIAEIAEGFNLDNVLGYYARALFDGSTTLFGKYPPSRKLEPIPNTEKGKCIFSPDLKGLQRHGTSRNLYEDLQIKRSDILRRITELKDLSVTLSREELAGKLNRIYAEAVGLRNHAASLRIVDAATEARMDELQGQLIELIEEITPLKAINLHTLNTYDPSNHIQMLCQNPKRTLEFSELLRRIQHIIDRLDDGAR